MGGSDFHTQAGTPQAGGKDLCSWLVLRCWGGQAPLLPHWAGSPKEPGRVGHLQLWAATFVDGTCKFTG